MAFKEKPLIDAGSKGAGVPDFFFATPFWSGFFGMIVAASLGGFCIGVPASLFAGGDSESLLVAIEIGAVIAMAIGMIANLARNLSPAGDRVELQERSQTTFGGLIAIGIVLPLIWFLHEPTLKLMEKIAQSQEISSSLPRMPGF